MTLYLRQCLFLFLVCCFASSCASLFNSRYKRIEVQTSEPCRIEVANSKLETQNSELGTQHWETVDNWVEIRVRRSKSPLILRVLPADSFAREYRLLPKMSGTVWLDIAATPFVGLGLYGLLIDHASPKYFTYPGSVYVDMVNDQVYRSDPRPPQRGEAYIGLAMPTANVVKVAWPGQDFRSGEFNWGFSMWYEHYYRQGTALCLKSGFSVEQQYAKSVFVSAGQRHWAGPLQFAYGLGYTGFFRSKHSSDYRPVHEINQVIVRRGVGPMLGVGARLGRHLMVNIDFQSILLNIDPDVRWKYSSFWAFEVGWRVPLRNR